ncbi:unnamed protein product [Paramecium pentaurelia]|uniref:RING-type domain-containing protein n=1 Tax=Paramecium pentaurelia TaxID=43138 RepID=A0A8S1SFV9_9CILI|nr:unnamed protein product [Paramecium pentaurelia]
MLNKSQNSMQICQLCKMTSQNPIQLICSHSLCLKCGLKIQIQENTSQIQNKFRIQCPKCNKMTHTYDIKNLLLESNELYLITDSSEMEKEVLNESQFSLQKNQQEAIFGRRESNAYQIQEVFSKNSQMLNVQAINNNAQTAFNHNHSNKKKAIITNEKTSPTKQFQKPAQQNHQKKQSYQMPHPEIALECKAKTQANTSNVQQQKLNDFLKPNSNTPVATPTTLSSQLLFQQTDNKKQIAQVQAVQQYKQKQKTQNTNIYVQEHLQNAINQNQSDIVFPQQIKKNNNQNNLESVYHQQVQHQISIFDKYNENNKQMLFDDKQKCTIEYNKEKENQFLKEISKDCQNSSNQTSDNSRHKRSSTGLIQEVEENASVQIIQSYFQMVQKNVQKLERDVINAANGKQIDPQIVYSKLKVLTSRIGDNDGELVQSIKVMQKLQQEILGLSTPSQHRKTSSHQNTSHRYTNSSNYGKNIEKSDQSIGAMPQELKIYKKFL